jgi:putative GTP pyrophosphokinase
VSSPRSTNNHYRLFGKTRGFVPGFFDYLHLVYNYGMSFPSVPSLTKSAINRAGKTIKVADPSSAEYADAISVVNAWRVAHAYPINTFNATLRKKTKKYPGTIVAQRLKRLPTIIDKLCRHNGMALTSMQDIGGVRAIVPSIADLKDLRDNYVLRGNFTHEFLYENDYITIPKPDGYRGIHLIYGYNNTLTRYGDSSQYRGLIIELQFRTLLQHQWATAVETAGVMRREGLKYQKGDSKWLEFFELVSSIFAIAEDTAVLEKHTSMNTDLIFESTYRLIVELKVLDVMKSWSVAAKALHREGMGGYYNIILLNTSTSPSTVRIIPFSKDSIDSASKRYAELETKSILDGTPEPVLVSVGGLKNLQKAYPNYFLDILDFVKRVEEIVQTVELGV